MVYVIMGKSGAGKDTIFKKLLSRAGGGICPVVPYTTRPMRKDETEGVDYHFIDDDTAGRLRADGKVIEERVYETVNGPWRYMTVDDGKLSQSGERYLMIGTPEAYLKLREHLGKENVLAVYITLDDGERLSRSLRRERLQKEPNYRELCRRFLADEEDFSEEKLREAQITAENTFFNMDLDRAADDIIKHWGL